MHHGFENAQFCTKTVVDPAFKEEREEENNDAWKVVGKWAVPMFQLGTCLCLGLTEPKPLVGARLMMPTWPVLSPVCMYVYIYINQCLTEEKYWFGYGVGSDEFCSIKFRFN